ncbi:hypothetical protein [Reyranella massiliensis]|uniref:hypothetical protein n=1 Tax=Reyranella massiliensis TaxID=445220 RepID=UPI0002FE0BC6|nr:hypothetical protein [Reyranella massiliensis]
MNVAEKLAREIRRVAGLRHHYEEIGDVAILLMDAALEQGCKAIGSGDPIAMIAAGQDLEGFSE